MKSHKTPLRYPGGKSRACIKMDPYIPDLRDYNEYREPFLGGGSVAIHITKKYPRLKVWVNDLYEPLCNFWRVLQNDGNTLYETLCDLKSRHPDPVYGPQKSGFKYPAKELFLKSKEYLNDESNNDPLQRAVSFYIINKCSFSGLTESSSFSKQASKSNFSLRGIQKLPGYTQLISNWKITNMSYENLMDNEWDTFVYLDPPYDIKDNLYGKKGSMHKGFDHDRFAKDCDECFMPQLISYNSDQLVKNRFKKWRAAEFDLTYTMRSVGEYMREQKKRKELLLFNYGTERLVEFN